jgi:hypothetical protein
MREMSAEEVEERRRRHGESRGDEAKGKGKAVEKWYTFEHDGGYRQVQLQFLGAVRSHGELPPGRWERPSCREAEFVALYGGTRPESVAGAVVCLQLACRYVVANVRGE